MSLSPEVDLDTFILRPDAASGAVIAAIMQNAGMLAVRKGRYLILQGDIEEAYNTQIGDNKSDKFDFYR
jgi:26S proteasome regulatory subunit T3